MNRSTKLKSRVFRNLQNYDMKNSNIVDEEIYDQLTQAQDRIISDAFTDKIVTLTLVADQDTYDLTTDDILSIERTNIASVKVMKTPSDWVYVFEVVPNKEFVDYVNSRVTGTGQPCKATIIDGKLKVYPVPTSDYESDEIDMYVYLGSSAGEITATDLPEIPNYYDKSLELFATSQFLIGDDRLRWLKEFEAEFSRVKPIYGRKHHNLQRPQTTGWINGSSVIGEDTDGYY